MKGSVCFGILESTENSNVGGTLHATATVFHLGDAPAKKQHRSILSFNTGSLPDNAVITALILRVKQNVILGDGNLVSIFGGFKLDIKTGFFGTLPGLQISDFQAFASKTLGPASPSLTGGFCNFNIINGKSAINKFSSNGGFTQIRLRFKLDDNNNALANTLSLYSRNAPAASRPQLIIVYTLP